MKALVLRSWRKCTFSACLNITYSRDAVISHNILNSCISLLLLQEIFRNKSRIKKT